MHNCQMPSPHVLRKTTSIITAFDYLLATAFNYEVKFDLYASDRVYNLNVKLGQFILSSAFIC